MVVWTPWVHTCCCWHWDCCMIVESPQLMSNGYLIKWVEPQHLRWTWSILDHQAHFPLSAAPIQFGTADSRNCATKLGSFTSISSFWLAETVSRHKAHLKQLTFPPPPAAAALQIRAPCKHVLTSCSVVSNYCYLHICALIHLPSCIATCVCVPLSLSMCYLYILIPPFSHPLGDISVLPGFLSLLLEGDKSPFDDNCLLLWPNQMHPLKAAAA